MKCERYHSSFVDPFEDHVVQPFLIRAVVPLGQGTVTVRVGGGRTHLDVVDAPPTLKSARKNNSINKRSKDLGALLDSCS